MDEHIHLHLNAQQALPLISLITLRLEFLASQPPSPQVQVEYQALRSIALQIRNGAETKVSATSEEEVTNQGQL